MSLSIYGKLPSGERLKRITAAPNYNKGSFQNISNTPAMAEDASFFKMMREFLNKPANIKPPKPLPSVSTNLKALSGSAPQLVWFGHSSYLLKINGKTILVDPVLSGNAAPVSCMVRAFKGADVYKPEHMPAIDVLLLTHDHYDHLDYKTVTALKSKVKTIVCSLGVGSHFEHWGFDKKKINELNWWEEWGDGELKLIAAPARHFSGRGIKRGQSLWASYILKAPGCSIYLGGDSGYDSHFKEIGKRYGGFDLAILESGQYNKSWPHIHMMPEQTVQASLDLGAKALLPVHWAKFSLAMHAWDEPVKRILKKAEALNVNVATPMIGEVLTIGGNMPNRQWWTEV